jgi:hypothetical protein
MRQGVIALLLLFSSLTFGQESKQPHVSIKELLPESIPAGTCKDDASGFLTVTKNGKTETHLTDKQLGEYVRVRLSQGYTVTLYPQASGDIFVFATCESAKHQ